MNLFPLVSFEQIENDQADALLIAWGHYLGACNRPFGKQYFGLEIQGKGIVSVSISASTVNKRCASYDRQECVELARLCSRPGYQWATRICLRLWREIGARAWPFWPVRTCVNYSNSTRHAGDIYRFDGWKHVADVHGGGGGGSSWTRKANRETKKVWAFEFTQIEARKEQKV